MNLIFNIYFFIVNIISFVIYFIDKKLAIKHRYRIPERILIMLSIIGGSIGSLLSMMFFHHKTKHMKFIILNPILVCVWIYIILSINKII